MRDASYREASSNCIERALDFPRGMLGDEPSGLGEHGHIDA